MFESIVGRLGLALLAVAALGACAGANDEHDGSTDEAADEERTAEAKSAFTTNVFDLDAYESSLVYGLQHTNGAGGYAYAIYQNGALLRSGAAGSARTKPAAPWTADTPFSMMSMSKTITAAAVVKLLAERDDISLSSPIAGYLPSGWSHDPDLDGVTFRHLLSHTSGFTTGVDPWSGLQKQVASGVSAPYSVVDVNGTPTPAGVGTYFYSNTNFTLERVMMAYMMNKPAAIAAEQAGSGDAYTSGAYRSRVVASIFTPIGLDTTAVDDQPIGVYPAGFFDASGGLSYYEPTDGSTKRLAGAGFWNLSVKSYAKFIDALSHGTYVVTKNGSAIDPWTYMTTMVGAWNNPDVGLGLFRTPGKYGTYFTHDGIFSIYFTGGCSRWMRYPNGLTAVWVMNSNVLVGGTLYCPVPDGAKLMVDSYDHAWSVVPSVSL